MTKLMMPVIAMTEPGLLTKDLQRIKARLEQPVGVWHGTHPGADGGPALLFEASRRRCGERGMKFARSKT